LPIPGGARLATVHPTPADHRRRPASGRIARRFRAECRPQRASGHAVGNRHRRRGSGRDRRFLDRASGRTIVSASDITELAVGDEVASAEYAVSRADLVRYAGASGDDNPIHWNERFAREVGLDGVIAHGMFTMGTAVNVVVDWIGDP